MTPSMNIETQVSIKNDILHYVESITKGIPLKENIPMIVQRYTKSMELELKPLYKRTSKKYAQELVSSYARSVVKGINK